jgi:hypothetical protein
VCNVAVACLQISPLNDRYLNCPRCGGEMVFVSDWQPISEDDAKKLFRNLRINYAIKF